MNYISRTMYGTEEDLYHVYNSAHYRHASQRIRQLNADRVPTELGAGTE